MIRLGFVRPSDSFCLRLVLLLPMCWAMLPSTAQAQDHEAVERRLGRAVAAGELTLEQANRMMEALRQDVDPEAAETMPQLEMASEQSSLPALDSFDEEASPFLQELELIETTIQFRELIDRGDMTVEQAQALLEELEENPPQSPILWHFARRGVNHFSIRWVCGDLVQQGIQPRRVERSLPAMYRMLVAIQSEGEEFELDSEIRHYLLEDVGLTHDQIALMVDATRLLSQGSESE